MKKIHTVVAVLCIALAGAGAWWWQGPGQGRGADLAGPPAARTAAGQAGGAGRAAGAPRGGPGGTGSAAAVEVAAAQAVTLSDDVQAVGSLRSRQGVTLRPEVSGRVARLGFRDGHSVKRGQLMLQLDDTLQRAQLQQAQAQAGIAHTNLQRSRELLAQNFVSQSAVDQNAASLQVAEAQVALAQAQLARMRVLAPFDGTVGIGLVDVGEYVRDGTDIVKLEDLSVLNMDFRLPERYMTRIRTGQAMEVSLDAVPGQRFAAQVEALDVQVDADGRALRVRARLADRGGLLKPGMFARGRVVFSVRDNAVMVPEEALVPQGGRQLLFKVVDGPGGQRLSQRLEAKIGARQPGRVEILQGLAPGELVVTAGHARLLRGDAVPVRVVELDASAEPSAPVRPAAAAAASTLAPAGGPPRP